MSYSFLSKDPIGISGGLNQYVFCGNNPVNFVDPMGFFGLGFVVTVSLEAGVGPYSAGAQGTIGLGGFGNSFGPTVPPTESTLGLFASGGAIARTWSHAVGAAGDNTHSLNTPWFSVTFAHGGGDIYLDVAGLGPPTAASYSNMDTAAAGLSLNRLFDSFLNIVTAELVNECETHFFF